MAKALCGLNYGLSPSTICSSFIVLAYKKQDREKETPHPQRYSYTSIWLSSKAAWVATQSTWHLDALQQFYIYTTFVEK